MSYRDPTLPVTKRIDDLLNQMTLDEKLAQLTAFWVHELMDGRIISFEKVERLLSNGIGQITRVAGASVLEPLASSKTANALQRHLVEKTRLGIPAIVHEECCCGYMALGGTTFPQIIGLASTFQPELAEEMTTVIRTQMRAVGAHQGLAPVLDVARDARWGRVEETFGEDPTLVSQFGMAYIRGLQGKSLKEGGVMATGKHFVGHGLSQGGQNCAPVHMGLRDLWDIYLAPFQAAIRDAGLHTIMNAYPELDGEVVAASRRILTDMLRNQLGFDGLVVSDYEAIRMIHDFHNAAADKTTAAGLALNAGIDVELPASNCYGDPLKAAIEAGRVTMEVVDTAVRRHLQKKFELGLFENPYVDEGRVLEVFETPAQRSLASEIARKSMVLLKNDGLLPLQKEIKTLAVIGPNADDGRKLLGDYSYAALLDIASLMPSHNPSFEDPDPEHLARYGIKAPTILDSLHSILPQTRILYARGCDNSDDDTGGFDEAAKVAEQAEVVLLVLGDRSGLTPSDTVGETRDSAGLHLPGVQERLAEAISSTGKPVVVVLVTGRPYAINSISEKANAILEAWLPGEEGGAAIAGTLFGDSNPGGKLPMSFPRCAGQMPLFYNQKPSGGKSNWYVNYVDVESSPLYPFGHGLSYTTFQYGEIAIFPNQVEAGGTVRLNLDVKNTGRIAGDEVVQLYICDEYASIPRPVKELKGYARLTLQPGESRSVTFQLPVDQLAFYDEDLNLVVEPGTFKVMIGSSSADFRAEGAFKVIGEKKTPVRERVFVCPVEVK
jgi:beta-glucosidase